MDTTNSSLLERLRLPLDQKSWSRFVDLYTPLIYSWARRVGLQDPDAEDLHTHRDTVEKPLNTLDEKALCPGSAALDKFNASLR